jgi:membrane associated rhomboid family serine protease
MTYALIVSNVFAFLLEASVGERVIVWFALWPPGGERFGQPGFHVWQLATYSVLHANSVHLAFNMWGLYMFGKPLEHALGAQRMLQLYMTSVIAGALAQTAAGLLIPTQALPSVGASAGVFGVLLGFALLFPNQQVVLLFPPVPMPAWLFALGYALFEFALGVGGLAPGVAHFAHLGGMAGALVLIVHWARTRRHHRIE